MAITNMKPHHRVILGRNITLTAGAFYALSRAISYATMDPDRMTEAQLIITAEGRALGAWAVVWFIAAVMCVADMINRHTRYGLSVIVGIAFTWAAFHLGIWAWGGFSDFNLVAIALGWFAPAGMVFGLLLKVTALQDMLRCPHSKGVADGD
jgi:hypothetical protein